MTTLDQTSGQRLTTIRERHAAATEGPWWFDESDNCWRLHGVMGRIPPQCDGLIPEQIINKQILKAAKHGTPYAEYWPGEADGAFIANAWKDVRDLLDEVDRLTAAARDSDAYALDKELTEADAERADLANQVSVLKDHVAALESGTRAALAIDWDTLRAAVASMEGVEPSAVSAVLGAFRQAVQP